MLRCFFGVFVFVRLFFIDFSLVSSFFTVVFRVKTETTMSSELGEALDDLCALCNVTTATLFCVACQENLCDVSVFDVCVLVVSLSTCHSIRAVATMASRRLGTNTKSFPLPTSRQPVLITPSCCNLTAKPAALWCATTAPPTPSTLLTRSCPWPALLVSLCCRLSLFGLQ